MYILVTNIPEGFRTPDMRNYFSKVIEEQIFNCFHFRHRPHCNFLTLFREWEIRKTNNKDKDKDNELNDQRNLTSDDNKVICVCDSADKSRPNSLRDMGELVGCASACNCQNNGMINEGNDAPSDNDLRSNKDSHWLSSGLSGLTSLIKEKKSKAHKEKPYDKFDKKTSRSADTYKRTLHTQRSLTGEIEQHRPLDRDEEMTKDAEIIDPLDSAQGKCCIVDVKENFVGKFKSLYHKKFWVDRQEKDYEMRGTTNELLGSLTDIRNMIEFRPPSIMPQGNVGTPTAHFQDLIRSCQLPGTIITKLGLQFPRKRGKKRFGEVPFDYGTEIHIGESENRESRIAFTASGHLIPASVDPASAKKRRTKKQTISRPRLDLQDEEEDGTEVEEWERYEAFHDDVTSQERTKERLYEKEIELVWEKGGPGLVFYTDSQFWRAQDGDFDEQTTDEWDVDMSVYYEKGAGDKDAKDSVNMTQSVQLREGTLSQSVFGGSGERRDGEKDVKKQRKLGPKAPPKIGQFEAHTRGFGRRLMESQGWRDGVGLGKKRDGLPYALDNDGQHPLNKKGFGYHGEKLQGWGQTSAARPRTHGRSSTEMSSGIRISTVFDAPRDADPPPPSLRSSEPTRLSHRDDRSNILFTKANESTEKNYS